jgi:hypothetical protein
MNIFGTRMAGDVFRNLGNAYTSVDSKFGGVLPYGVEADAGELLKEVGLDALPGARHHAVAGDLTEKGSKLGQNVVDGNLVSAGVKAEAGRNAGKLREHLVEEGLERIGKRTAQRFLKRGALGTIPVVGQAVTTYDAINDGLALADIGVLALTGKGYGQHVDDTIAMRDSNSGLNALDVKPGYVGEGDHVIGQGLSPNPFQGVINRGTRVVKRFNPLQADFGISEAMGWN